MMWGQGLGRRGQSILEYLLVAAAVIAGLFFVATKLGTSVEGVGTEAGKAMTKAKTDLSTELTHVKR